MKKDRKDAYVIFRMPDERRNQLARLAYMQGLSNSAAVRQAVDLWIALAERNLGQLVVALGTDDAGSDGDDGGTP